MKLNKAALTISRPQGGGRSHIRIELKDDDAVTTFFRGDVDLADFSEALTGLAYVPIKAEVFNLDNVGKKRESKTIKFQLPENSGRSVELATIAARAACPEGWEPALYFGSQGSFFARGEEWWAKCSINRWVEINP